MADCIANAKQKQSVTYSPSGGPQRYIRQLRMVQPVVTGYDLYNEEFDDETGFYFVCPQEATNLIKNPTFYKDLWGWSNFNAQSQRTNAWAFDSGFSIMINGSGDDVTAERREYVETEIDNFVPGEYYTFSMYAWLPWDWDVSDLIMGTISIVDIDGGGVEDEVFSDKISNFGVWERLTVTKQINTTAERVVVRLNLRSQDQQSNNPPDYLPTGNYNLATEYIFFDYGQFELGIDATTPFHGDYQTCDDNCDMGCRDDWYTWVGTPHRSASKRSGCARDGGVLCSFHSLGAQVLSHTGHSAPPVRDISYPYANKPGEYYQKTAVDARILTFTLAFCGTLKDLECELFQFGEKFFPDTCGCRGEFLLVYRYKSCDQAPCNPERDIAICASYIGGAEGARDNLFQQRITLQFKAHNPFWFSWPGHQSKAISFNQFSLTEQIIRLNSDGSIASLPIGDSLNLTTAACLAGGDKTVIGGDFSSPNGGVDCINNVAVIDCQDICEDTIGTNSPVSVAITDGAGNVIVGTTGGQLVIYYASGGQGSFPGYPGGYVRSIVAPFWAQIAVGTTDGVYVMKNDGTWLSYITDFTVYGLAMEPNGNLIAVGSFNVIDGVAANGIARFNVNATGCLDADTGVWEAFDFGFDGKITAVAVDPNTGSIYLGAGSATATVPNTEAICDTSDQESFTSSGSNQEIRFTNLGGGIYTLELRLTNIITREKLAQCTSYIRVTASSTTGTKYNFLFGTHNITAGPTTGAAGALWTISWNIDVNAALGDPCATQNTDFITELTETTDFLTFVTPLTLPGGVGIDNEVSSVTGQCVTLTTTYSADPVSFNGVLKIDGDTAVALGDGTPIPVNTIMVHPDTGEVWAGFDVPSDPYRDGLAIWNGQTWSSFPGYLGSDTQRSVLSLNYCGPDCSVIIVFEGGGASVVPGYTDIQYNGSAANADAKLIIQGPGKVEYFSHNGSGNKAQLCLELQCDEIATINYGSGSLSSNFRRQLGSSILAGSRLDICLNKCDNPFSLFIDPTTTDATTHATMLWNDYHWGIEGLCCGKGVAGEDGNTPTDVPDINTTCCKTLWQQARNPNDQDCAGQGYQNGDLWVNLFGYCKRLFISTADTCVDDAECDPEKIGYVDSTGAYLVDEFGNSICPEQPDTCA